MNPDDTIYYAIDEAAELAAPAPEDNDWPIDHGDSDWRLA